MNNIQHMEVRGCDECGRYFMAPVQSGITKCDECRAEWVRIMLNKIWNKSKTCTVRIP